MGEVMTMKQIEKNFDKEWVLVGNPVCAKNLNVKKGVVLWHGTNRDELYKQAEKFRNQYNFAYLYIGKHSDDLVYLL